MKYFTVELKKEFPMLQTNQNPVLHCYVNDIFRRDDHYNAPGMLIMPGGGYAQVCFDREGECIAFWYLKAGYCAFVLQYSVAPGAHFPEQLCEEAAAMLYIRRHAKEWRLDPEKIAVSGFSAGGHLACSLGTMCNDPAVTGLLGVTPQEIAPNAMVLGYPVIAADPAIAHVWSIKNVSGVEDTSSPDYLKFGLEHKVNEFTPPTYLWHTADDNCVPCKNSLMFAAALAEHGIMYELHIFPHGPHGLAACDLASSPYVDEVAALANAWVDESIRFLAVVFGK